MITTQKFKKDLQQYLELNDQKFDQLQKLLLATDSYISGSIVLCLITSPNSWDPNDLDIWYAKYIYPANLLMTED